MLIQESIPTEERSRSVMNTIPDSPVIYSTSECSESKPSTTHMSFYSEIIKSTTEENIDSR